MGTTRTDQLNDIEKFKNVLEEGDGQNIINLLTKRSGVERLKFKLDVEQSYDDDDGKINLIELVKNKLQGEFRHLIVAMLTLLPTFYAEELRRAFKGFGTNEDAVQEILSTVNNDQLQVIKKHFFRKYNRELIDDIKGDTSGCFSRLLERLSNGERVECPHLDIQKLKAKEKEDMVRRAKKDAQALYDGGVKRWGTDEDTFCQIMCQQSHIQLRLIFEEYIKVSRNHEMEDLIEKEFSNAKEEALANYNKQDFKIIKGLFSDEEQNTYDKLVKAERVEDAIESVLLGDKKNILKEDLKLPKNRRIEEVIKRKFSNNLENVLKEYRGFCNATDETLMKYRSVGVVADIKEMFPDDENALKKYNELIKSQEMEDQKNVLEECRSWSRDQMIEEVRKFSNNVTNAFSKYRWLAESTKIETAIKELFSSEIISHQHKIEAAIEQEFLNARNRFLANYRHNQDCKELIEKVFSDEDKNKYDELVKTQEVEDAIESVFLGDKKIVLEEYRRWPKNHRIVEVIKRKFSNDLENVLKEYRRFWNTKNKALQKYRSLGVEAVIKEVFSDDENALKKYKEVVKTKGVEEAFENVLLGDQKNTFEEYRNWSRDQRIEGVINWKFSSDVANALHKYRWVAESTEIKNAVEELLWSDNINVHEVDSKSQTKIRMKDVIRNVMPSYSKSVPEEDSKHTIETIIEKEFSYARDRALANYRIQDFEEIIEEVFSDEEKNKYAELIETKEVEDAIDSVFLGDKENDLEEYHNLPKNHRIQEVIKRKFSNDLKNVLEEYHGLRNARDKAFEEYRSRGVAAVIKEKLAGDENALKKYDEVVKTKGVEEAVASVFLGDPKNDFEEYCDWSRDQRIERVINWKFSSDVTNALRKYRWLAETTDIKELLSSHKTNVHEKNRNSQTESQGMVFWKKKKDTSGYGEHTIEAAIEKEFSGDMKNALLAIVESVQNKPKFFAKQLHNSMKKWRATIKTKLMTSNLDVIRIVVTRCEKDMDDIKKEYATHYASSLADAIKDNTTGYLQKGLLALIKEK